MHLHLTIIVTKVIYSALAASDIAATASGSSTPGGGATGLETGGVDPVSQQSTNSGTATLHISGKVSSENPHVKKGAYHTLDLEVGRDFTIIKGEGEWDSIARERIFEVTEPGRGAEVGAIVCGDGACGSRSKQR